MSFISRPRPRFFVATAVALSLFAVGACGESPGGLLAPEDGARLNSAANNGAPTVTVTTVMRNLDAPRGLAIGPEGALYVVEAGETEYNPARCVPVYRGRNCWSGSGAVSRLWKGKQTRFISGLPSFYNPDVNDIGGPQDIGFFGGGKAVVSIGWGGSPNSRDAMAALFDRGHAFGTLIQIPSSKKWTILTDIAAFERTNGGGGLEDSNPYGLLVEPGVKWVADAGGNTIVRVDANGSTSLAAAFPATPIPPTSPFFPMFPQYEAVPTEVQRGPDGSLWVSTLSGAPFLPGAAAIWRVTPGQPPVPIITGLTMVPDFAIAKDGTVWVTRYASAPFFGGPAALDRIAPDGTRTSYLVGGLVQPTGIAIGGDGEIYVSNRGSQENVGEVLRIVIR